MPIETSIKIEFVEPLKITNSPGANLDAEWRLCEAKVAAMDGRDQFATSGRELLVIEGELGADPDPRQTKTHQANRPDAFLFDMDSGWYGDRLVFPVQKRQRIVIAAG